MGWFIGIGIEIGIEIARIDDEVDSDSDSDSDFDALHEVAVDKLRIADASSQTPVSLARGFRSFSSP